MNQKARDKKYNAMVKEYRKLAKRADQRLVRLERYAQQEKYKNIKEYAYRVAMRDIRSWSGENANRFNTKPPSHMQSLQAKINDIKKFLGSASSSIKPTADNAVYKMIDGVKTLVAGGIDLTYQKRADTLNQKYGTNITWENIGQLFESALYRKMEKKYGSSSAVMIIGKLQTKEEDVLKAFKEKKPIHMVIPMPNDKDKRDKILEEKVNNALRYYKKDINSLYGAL